MLSLGVGLFESAVREKGPAPGGDVTAPAQVTDLELVGPPFNGEALIGWTAAGDDGLAGLAAEFDIRWRSDGAILNAAQWNSAISLFGGWAVNSVSGGLFIDYLINDTGFAPIWVAVRYRDEAGNVGPISNSLQIDNFG